MAGDSSADLSVARLGYSAWKVRGSWIFSARRDAQAGPSPPTSLAPCCVKVDPIEVFPFTCTMSQLGPNTRRWFFLLHRSPLTHTLTPPRACHSALHARARRHLLIDSHRQYPGRNRLDGRVAYPFNCSPLQPAAPSAAGPKNKVLSSVNSTSMRADWIPGPAALGLLLDQAIGGPERHRLGGSPALLVCSGGSSRPTWSSHAAIGPSSAPRAHSPCATGKPCSNLPTLL